MAVGGLAQSGLYVPSLDGSARPWLDDLVRAKRRPVLPVVLTRDEVRAILDQLDGPRVMAMLIGAGGVTRPEILAGPDLTIGIHRPGDCDIRAPAGISRYAGPVNLVRVPANQKFGALRRTEQSRK
jgi:hypothetical protein